jgi:hypothetical protein
VSGVFLYVAIVAIVAIWIFVLVPRWLRRHHAQPYSPSREDIDTDGSLPGDDGADSDDMGEPGTDSPADELATDRRVASRVRR